MDLTCAPDGITAESALPGRRRLALRFGAGAMLLGAAVIAALHVVGPGRGISVVHRTISEYGLTGVAGVFNAAVVAFAAGAAAVLFAATRGPLRRVRSVRPGVVAGAVSVAGLLMVAAFAKQDWSVPMTVSGTVHRVGSLAAFIGLPVAVMLLTRRGVRRGAPARGWAAGAWAAAAVGLMCWVPIVISIVVVGARGGWWMAVPLGLLERGMAVADLAAMLLLAVWSARGAGSALGRAPQRRPGG